MRSRHVTVTCGPITHGRCMFTLVAITHWLSLFFIRHFLVTCADDGRIRLWGTSTTVDYEVPGCVFQAVSQ